MPWYAWGQVSLPQMKATCLTRASSAPRGRAALTEQGRGGARRSAPRRKNLRRSSPTSQDLADRAPKWRASIVVEPVTVEHRELARQAFLDFGKGRHKAGLNFGDCFSYALAKATGEPLLFKGNDFSLTDIKAA